MSSLTLSAKNRRLLYFAASVALTGALAFWAWQAQPPVVFYLTAGWFVTVALLLWAGNRQLTHGLDRLMPWAKWGNLRFFVHLAAGLIYLLLLMNASYMALKLLLTTDPPTSSQLIVTNVYGAFIFIPVFCVYFSLHFLRHWRKSELEAEKMQKENIRSQLTSLKSQLDPHFLFNNLNILSALIGQDTHRSKLFIDKFADVYRGLLQSKSGDLILLTEELEFIESYMYLIRTRFEDHVRFTVNLKPGHKTRMIPPLTIQMLIENAIKHNLITEAGPLTIHLWQPEDDYLIISNNLNAKPTTERKGSGLENIQSRYACFTDRPVHIKRTDTHFEVTVPLLEIEHI